MLLFSFILLNTANAQNLTGVVKDATTHLPIGNVQVYSLKSSTSTDENGRFKIENLMKGSNLSFRIMGYETVELVFGGSVTDTIIYLNVNPIYLKEIKVQTNRNYKRDSINLRRDYAKVFNSKQTKIGDLFIKKSAGERSINSHLNPNSTSSLVSVNLLKVASLLSRKRDPLQKFKSTLLRDEEDRYIDHIFSKEKVGQLTELKGDSLTIFINKYRPNAQTLKKMTPYELTMYIKECEELEKIKK